MSEYKEFTGKNLDEAIQEACTYYALERNKLELEIISGGSSGIFGLVGKKKAVVKARPRVAQSLADKPKPAPSGSSAPAPRAAEEEAVQTRAEASAQDQGQAQTQATGEPKSRQEVRSEPRQGRGRRPRHKKAPRPEFNPEDYAPDSPDAPDTPGALDIPIVSGVSGAPSAPGKEIQPTSRVETPAAATASAPESAGLRNAANLDLAEELDEDLDEDFGGEAPEVEEKPLDQPELEALLRKTVSMLIEPMVGQVDMSLTQTPDRVRVRIVELSEEDSGLLIGRDGQTINAVQYLVNRVVGKQWPESVRVQIDAGNYRERQDDKLRKVAYFLAGKAKSSGRAQSTKPLSSYHRRIIHLALQSDPSVQTRSKGEGPLKRVLILPARPGGKGSGGNNRSRGGNSRGNGGQSQE